MASPNVPRKKERAVHHEFRKQVGSKETRKLKARRSRKSLWFGLGMFGIVGWSVAVPAVLCIFLGVWIDVTWPGQYSWTLMLLIIGIILGCVNAWIWINRQRESIKKERENSGD